MAKTFGEVARTLAEHADVQQTLDKILHLAVEALEACDFEGISFIERGKITSPASSNDVPRLRVQHPVARRRYVGLPPGRGLGAQGGQPGLDRAGQGHLDGP
ncbi:MAG: hypothetical protein M3507_08870 [Actinomycetota bacterium]|nr:hypothetical protein [Actinomycetota bacterium]